MADSASFVEGLKKVTTSVAFTLKEDETASVATITAPVPHYLESWNDLSLTRGTYSLTQPTIRPLFNTKQFQDVLLSLNGNAGTFYDYIKETAASITAGSTWNKVLHDGVFVGVIPTASAGSADYAAAASTLSKSKAAEAFELVLYTKTGLGDGQQANNPWLQEFPDPITRVSWDNYVTVSNADAKKLGLSNEIVANGGLNGSYATITTADGTKLENVPVIVQPVFLPDHQYSLLAEMRRKSVSHAAEPDRRDSGSEYKRLPHPSAHLTCIPDIVSEKRTVVPVLFERTR
jgi:molybdopterin-containing oxidoreductase family iron-sulfur binding subunit